MDEPISIIEEIELMIQGIHSHAAELTTGNVSHNRTYIKGAAEICLEDLAKLKSVILCQK